MTRPTLTRSNGSISPARNGSPRGFAGHWRRDEVRRVVKLPDIGEGTTEAEIVGWLVKVGDTVDEEDPLAEVMTDKATVEIPAPVAGTVGEKLAVGSDLVVLETEAAVPHQPAASPPVPPLPRAGEGKSAPAE